LKKTGEQIMPRDMGYGKEANKKLVKKVTKKAKAKGKKKK
jgi:hypothetical protein